MDEQLHYGDDYKFIPVTSILSGVGKNVTTDLYCYTIQVVNVCFIGDPNNSGEWTLVDAGMYAGDIIEFGKTDEIFFNAKHPYTWALISSLPQLGEKGEELYSIKGTLPNLFKEIKGDAFAPRNPYALKIDYVERPPYFKISDTHFAKTWLLHPNAPKVEPPETLKKFFEEGRRYANG